MNKDFNKNKNNCRHIFTKIDELNLLGGTYDYYHCELCDRIKVVAIKNKVEQSWKK